MCHHFCMWISKVIHFADPMKLSSALCEELQKELTGASVIVTSSVIFEPPLLQPLPVVI